LVGEVQRAKGSCHKTGVTQKKKKGKKKKTHVRRVESINVKTGRGKKTDFDRFAKRKKAMARKARENQGKEKGKRTLSNENRKERRTFWRRFQKADKPRGWGKERATENGP